MMTLTTMEIIEFGLACFACGFSLATLISVIVRKVRSPY